jgi:hypothetical protein
MKYLTESLIGVTGSEFNYPATWGEIEANHMKLGCKLGVGSFILLLKNSQHQYQLALK